MREKQDRLKKEKEEEQRYAQETLDMVKIRAQMEENFSTNKNNKTLKVVEANLQLKQEKFEQKVRERETKLSEEKKEVEMLVDRGRNQPYVSPIQ